jgi:DNA-binding beta-propeller fold protein YncE
MFDLEGKFVKNFGKRGSGPGEFSNPWGIVFDPSTRTILVADCSNNRVQIFSEEGNYLSHFATASNPCYIVLDDAGRIYVTLGDSNQVQVFEPRGTKELFRWGKGGNGDGDLSNPYGIAVNEKGEVIVCDYGNSRLSVFTKEGNFLRTMGKGEMSRPFAICMDGEGNILATDNSRMIVHVFDPEGEKIKEFGKAAGMANPRGISVDKGGRIVVGDLSNNRVLFF